MKKQIAVLLAPHQDDEALGAYLLLKKLVRESWQVYVVFATNGDYEGTAVSALRNNESLAVLAQLDIPAQNAVFLGYADTGMPYHKSFLMGLYQNSNAQEVVQTPNGSQTYVAGGGQSFHFAQYSCEALYCRHSFVEDLTHVLEQLSPELLILPSVHDKHGDHRALGLFWQELCHQLASPPQRVYAYLLHGGDDLVWPSRTQPHFDCPPCLSPQQWAERTTFGFSPQWAEEKKAALELYVSQEPQAYQNYLLSFAKEEEVFLSE